jgi:hypothetical protein
MSKLISAFRPKVTKGLGGTTLNKITDFYTSLEEAASTMLLRVDPYETRRSARIENAIYDKVYNYIAPSDLKGVTKIIDIRPIGERSNEDYLDGRFPVEFDIKKKENTVTVEMVNGVKTLRLSKVLTPRTQLFDANSLTLSGTVASSGDVTDLEIDTLNYISEGGALKFNLSGATGQGIITIPLNTAIDLSDMEGLGALFHWFKFPLASALTNVKIRWGNDSSNYFTATVTAPHDRTAFESDAWTLLRGNWSSAVETGTVDSEEIDWLQIEINYTSGTARNGVQIDDITAAKGQAWEVVYYSDKLFKSAAGTYLSLPTAETDSLILEGMAENIYYAELRKVLANEISGESRATNIQEAELYLEGAGEKQGAYELYERQYPSEAIGNEVTTFEFEDNLGF